MENLTLGDLSSRIELPICYDLYCGLGGWAEGFLSEGFRCIGYDIEKHDYGTGTYPGELILCDVRSIHGSQLADAACIVASPPCQEPSYRAMPWKRAKALNAIGPPHNFIELFNACFRIQREASEAAGRYIPMIVENVVGAQRWIGRARWHFGSYYLWGDVPALMPVTLRATKNPGFRFDGSGRSFQSESVKTVGHANMRDGHSHTRHLTNQRESDAVKSPGLNWNGYGEPGYKPQGFNVRNAQRFREHKRIEESGVKMQSPGHYQKPGSGPDWFDGGPAKHGSRTDSRKAASAEIAKIPFPLAQHIARCFRPVSLTPCLRASEAIS